jgi:hypothetical protein
MKNGSIALFLCAAVGVLAFLQFNTCRKAPSYAAEVIRQDSMMRHIADSVKLLQAREDSFVILRKDRIIDSLVPLVNMAKNAVNTKGHQIAGTIAAGQSARVLHDTVKILASCDSLVAEVQAGVNLVSGYEYLTDSLIDVLQQQRRIQDSILSLRAATIRLLQAGLDSSDVRYQHLYTDFTRQGRAGTKRFGIGPGIGATLSGGQVKGAITLSIHYDLIKF